MAQGTIKKLIAEKGFGFISTGGKKDIFFHVSGLVNCEFDALQIGTPVEYETEQAEKGPRAVKIRMI